MDRAGYTGSRQKETKTMMNRRFLLTATASILIGMAGSSHAKAADPTSVPVLGLNSASGLTLVQRNAGKQKDLIVQPGTDPQSVQLRFEGANRVEAGAGGSVNIVKADGSTWHYKPNVYQVINGKNRNVS